ncbi:hypothetical protein D0T51_04035 [Parabacteroides sp. 52]|uniref:PH domain-containing protein n=1 Tax=unclassified Parabacteroides TaxID=2649774 RepID=UPI0013D5E11A|nr:MULTISPECIES: PH domain-containing protein [unclassified Parabacteroides]MDH6534404.1 hypothetical protein [Parabacteroides sp. PM5-20]NDV54902.1 hypothetical protein [Parabacteroides sp. 52]
MDREFRSAVGWWYHLLIFMVMMGCVTAFLSTHIGAMIGMLGVVLLTLHVFLHTYYRVTAEGLLILHCSIFPEKKIAISEIEALETTMMPVFSYALSLDRIMIWSNGKQWMMISPKNKKEFVKLLREMNPDIIIKKENSFL